MAKIPPPAPVLVVKLDPEGNVASQEIVRPEPDYKKRMRGLFVAGRNNGWEPDEIVMTMRIMGEQETGEEIFVAHAYEGDVQFKIDKARQDHPEWRRIFFEYLKRPEERALATRTAPGSRSTGATMTDKDAYDVMYGYLRDKKHGEAAAALGLSYGQVYSARNGYTFKHVKP